MGAIRQMGIVGSVALLTLAAVTLPEPWRSFINIPGMIIVFGGTLLATSICRPARAVFDVLRQLPQLFREKAFIPGNDIEQIILISDMLRRGQVRNAEQHIANIDDSFARLGMQMVVDRRSLDELDKLAGWRIQTMQRQQLAKAHILRTMANFAPAFGMLGTLLGLVQMLHTLGSTGLSDIGSTMGFAMMTTLYGIAASNLVFKPLSIKIERNMEQRLLYVNLQYESIKLVLRNQHSSYIRELQEVYQLNTSTSLHAPVARLNVA